MKLKVDDRELLIALLDEPSGHVGRTLANLGVTKDAIRRAIDGYTPEVTAPQRQDTAKSVSYSGFVAAPIDAVWELIADPTRRAQWDGHFFATVDVREDGVIVATARVQSADGKPIKVRPELRVTEFVETMRIPGQFIEWEATWPGRPDPRYRRHFSVELNPEATGTNLTLTQSRLTYPGVRARAVAPLVRFSTRQGLYARLNAISRALR